MNEVFTVLLREIIHLSWDSISIESTAFGNSQFLA